MQLGVDVHSPCRRTLLDCRVKPVDYTALGEAAKGVIGHRCIGIYASMERGAKQHADKNRPASFRSLTFADDRRSLPLRPLGRQHGRVALVLSPLLDPREHGGIPQHVRHDAKDDLVTADIQLLQSGRLAPYVRLDTVLFCPAQEAAMETARTSRLLCYYMPFGAILRSI